jgi:hypothetical protein
MPWKSSGPPSSVTAHRAFVAVSTTCRSLPRTNETAAPSGLRCTSSFLPAAAPSVVSCTALSDFVRGARGAGPGRPSAAARAFGATSSSQRSPCCTSTTLRAGVCVASPSPAAAGAGFALLSPVRGSNHVRWSISMCCVSTAQRTAGTFACHEIGFFVSSYVRRCVPCARATGTSSNGGNRNEQSARNDVAGRMVLMDGGANAAPGRSRRACYGARRGPTNGVWRETRRFSCRRTQRRWRRR